MICGSTRFRIVRALQSGNHVDHEWTIGQLAKRVVTTQSNAGNILNALAREGKVLRVQEGTERPLWRWVK